MDRQDHLDDQHTQPQSEQARRGRNKRKARAVEVAWEYFLSRGDEQAGYRLPANPLAESVGNAKGVKVSAETALAYLRESSTWDPEDPFEREYVEVNGSETLYLKPRPGQELEDRLRRFRRLHRPQRGDKEGGNA